MNDCSVCIPAYNESQVIITKLRSELEAMGAEVVIVDDGSDIPLEGAIKHGSNFGYGSALMTAIKNATRDIVITIDGDGQHGAKEAKRLYEAWNLIPECDMLVGVRRIKGEKWHRLFGRKFLNWTASLICTFWLPDLNSGARVIKRSVAIRYFPILCRTFSFTTSLTISLICDGYKVEWFPIKVVERQQGKSHVNVVKHGLITLYYILRNGLALRTRWIRNVLRRYRWWLVLTGKSNI